MIVEIRSKDERNYLDIFVRPYRLSIPKLQYIFTKGWSLLVLENGNVGTLRTRTVSKLDDKYMIVIILLTINKYILFPKRKMRKFMV